MSDVVQAVAAVAVRGTRVLLVRSEKLGVVTPGGKIQEGETHEEALRREVREETGLDVLVFGRHLHTDVQPTFHCHLYAVEVEDKDPTAGDDAVEAWWGSPEEVKEGTLARDYSLILDVLKNGC